MYHPHDTHTGSCPTLQEHVSINTATVLMRLLGNGTRYPVHDVQLPSSAEGFLELCDHVATTWDRSERRSLLFSVAAEEVVDDVLPTRWFLDHRLPPGSWSDVHQSSAATTKTIVCSSCFCRIYLSRKDPSRRTAYS